MCLAMRMLAVVAAAATALAAAGAGATAPRAFVASYGSDANPCSRVAPCRTFGPALAQTASNGEIVVLDSAGYGSVTIAQSVTIAAPIGVYAGISVSYGSGVTVNGAGIEVVLRGLVINGSGDQAIHLVSAATLLVERCELTGMNGSGIFAEPGTTGYRLTVRDTTIAENHGTEGLFASGGNGVVILSGVRVVRNHGAGLGFSNGVSFFVRDSLIAQNGLEGILIFGAATQIVPMTIDRSRIYANGTVGVSISLSAMKSANLVISDTEIARNNLPPSSTTGGLLIDAFFPGLASATLTRTTIDGNGGNGVLVNSVGAYAIIDQSIVTGHSGKGVTTHPFNGAIAYSNVNNVFHHNVGGDLGYNVHDLGGQ